MLGKLEFKDASTQVQRSVHTGLWDQFLLTGPTDRSLLEQSTAQVSHNRGGEREVVPRTLSEEHVRIRK
jgi:hypothetical protein